MCVICETVPTTVSTYGITGVNARPVVNTLKNYVRPLLPPTTLFRAEANAGARNAVNDIEKGYRVEDRTTAAAQSASTVPTCPTPTLSRRGCTFTPILIAW